MILRIVQYGDPILRHKGDPVCPPDTALKSLANDMLETLKENNGLGLAAQQIGRALQLCVVDLSCLKADSIDFSFTYDGKKPPLALCMPLFILNPKLTRLRSPRKVVGEGCLSFPNLYLPVKRPHAIHLEFQDLEGTAHTLECDGLFARVIQHEVDHLQGILYIDRLARLKPEERVQLKGELATLERRNRRKEGTSSAQPPQHKRS